MTALLDDIRGKIGERCLVRKLSKDGCRVVMTNAPNPRLIVDFDRPESPLAADETRCDYLLIAEGKDAQGWVMVLELKRGQLHADKVVSQLQAGASAAEKLMSSGHAIRFRPIAVSGRTSMHERRQLRKTSIRFHEHKEPIRRMSCGDKLTTALLP